MAATASGKDKLLRFARLYVGGIDLSGDARSFSKADCTLEETELTGWSEAAKNYVAAGWPMLGLRGFEALMNDAASRSLPILQSVPGSDILSLCFGGGGEPAQPDPAYMLAGIQVADAISINDQKGIITADWIPQAGVVDQFARNPYGYVLHGPTAEAATFNGTSVDLTGGLFSLTNGAQAHLHILAADGVAWTLKVQHSANDSAWADLITFSANGTAITAERATASGTINRYVRMIGSKAGGTSLTAVCTFSPVNAP